MGATRASLTPHPASEAEDMVAAIEGAGSLTLLRSATGAMGSDSHRQDVEDDTQREFARL